MSPGWADWITRRADPVRVTSFLAASVAAGYLWAVVFGDGVRGLKDTPQLDQSTSFPKANVVFVGAWVLFIAASILAAVSSGYWRSRVPGQIVGRWIGATAASGAALFALSRTVS